MEYDKVTTFKNALIQHGSFNDRIYLLKIGKSDLPELIPSLDKLACENNYGKIFAKVPSSKGIIFLQKGYCKEASVPGLYRGVQKGVFLGKYLKQERGNEVNGAELDRIVSLAQNKPVSAQSVSLPEEFRFRFVRPHHVNEVCELYKEVFDSYPFPIYDPDYILETMNGNVLYFSIWYGDRLVALSSAEMDIGASNAEMTDFATLPEFRGNGLALFLLQKMEQNMGKLGIKTLYTIARAVSPGMNITFAKNGYEFSGRLKNNTNISGSLESMNVWYKKL